MQMGTRKSSFLVPKLITVFGKTNKHWTYMQLRKSLYLVAHMKDTTTDNMSCHCQSWYWQCLFEMDGGWCLFWGGETKKHLTEVLFFSQNYFFCKNGQICQFKPLLFFSKPLISLEWYCFCVKMCQILSKKRF